jgi:hypothetical protein
LRAASLWKPVNYISDKSNEQVNSFNIRSTVART